jgi:hypothetical protein
LNKPSQVTAIPMLVDLMEDQVTPAAARISSAKDLLESGYGNWQIREFSNYPNFPSFVLIKTLSRKHKYSIHMLRNILLLMA